jgi:hypothetical protein
MSQDDASDIREFSEEMAVSAEVWAKAVFSSADFGDKRLSHRLVILGTALGGKPLDSLPQACDSWAESLGGYRFIANKKTTHGKIMKAIADATVRACADQPVVYCVQDTTTLSFPRANDTEGLGPIGSDDVPGLLVHSALALNENGVPLGVLDQQWWAREGTVEPNCRDGKYKKMSLEEKESFKWFEGMDAVQEAFTRNLPRSKWPRLIHVFDREGDIHEVFEQVIDRDEGAVIRSSQNRRVKRDDGETDYAHNVVHAGPVLGTLPIKVPRQRGKPERTATVQVRATRVTLDPADPRHRDRRSLELGLVEVWEPDPPDEDDRLHWLLWTTEPVSTVEEALAIVAIYKKRWRIEDVHLTLKSGCRIEHVQFKTAERIAKVLAIYSAVAVRIVRLRDLARTAPEAPCTEVLTDCEWRTLWTRMHERMPEPDTPIPTMRQAALWIGRLGGHLGRKGDGMPGVRTLWRGWRDLQVMVTIYNAARR